MLQEPECPSWLYPVSMGATTTVSALPVEEAEGSITDETPQWERWNAMLPDGTIGPGQATSFNHYASGSVCAFLHQIVGGLSPASPGWKTALIRPRPGGTVRHASTSFDSPYGPYVVRWAIEGGLLQVDASVPPNAEARIELPGLQGFVGSGRHHFEVAWADDERWPPAAIQGAQEQSMPDVFMP